MLTIRQKLLIGLVIALLFSVVLVVTGHAQAAADSTAYGPPAPPTMWPSHDGLTHFQHFVLSDGFGICLASLILVGGIALML